MTLVGREGDAIGRHRTSAPGITWWSGDRHRSVADEATTRGTSALARGVLKAARTIPAMTIRSGQRPRLPFLVFLGKETRDKHPSSAPPQRAAVELEHLRVRRQPVEGTVHRRCGDSVTDRLGARVGQEGGERRVGPARGYTIERAEWQGSWHGPETQPPELLPLDCKSRFLVGERSNDLVACYLSPATHDPRSNDPAFCGLSGSALHDGWISRVPLVGEQPYRLVCFVEGDCPTCLFGKLDVCAAGSKRL
jgi:hypothetical protein